MKVLGVEVGDGISYAGLAMAANVARMTAIKEINAIVLKHELMPHPEKIGFFVEEKQESFPEHKNYKKRSRDEIKEQSRPGSVSKSKQPSDRRKPKMGAPSGPRKLKPSEKRTLLSLVMSIEARFTREGCAIVSRPEAMEHCLLCGDKFFVAIQRWFGWGREKLWCCNRNSQMGRALLHRAKFHGDERAGRALSVLQDRSANNWPGKKIDSNG